jgi:glutamate dehydrogenase (NAD(P)+)
VGIVEHNSAIYNSRGFDVDDVKHYFQKNKTLKGYAKIQEFDDSDPLSFIEKECDILIPAAIEKSINKDNADRL